MKLLAWEGEEQTKKGIDGSDSPKGLVDLLGNDALLLRLATIAPCPRAIVHHNDAAVDDCGFVFTVDTPTNAEECDVDVVKLLERGEVMHGVLPLLEREVRCRFLTDRSLVRRRRLGLR
jgi:hypothetical protein